MFIHFVLFLFWNGDCIQKYYGKCYVVIQMTRLMLECASTFNQDFKKVFFSLCPVLIAKTSSNRPLAIVFCWIVAWIQPDSSDCQQDFFCLKMISEGFRPMLWKNVFHISNRKKLPYFFYLKHKKNVFIA